VHAHADHGGDEQPQDVGQPADGGHQHDGDLKQLDQARQPALLDLLGDLPGGGREHHVGQDEQAGNEAVEQGRADAGPVGRVVGQDHQQGGLEDVVVEGAKELGPEERAEAARAEQGELVRGRLVAHAVLSRRGLNIGHINRAGAAAP